MTHKEMTASDVLALEHLIDRYDVNEILLSIAYICGAKAEHIATQWQDAHTAKHWMQMCIRLDAFASDHEHNLKGIAS